MHDRRPVTLGRTRVLCLTSAALLLGAAGCSSPLRDASDRELRRTVRETTERELAEARDHPDRRRLTRESRVETLRISPEVMQELGGMAGPGSYAGAPLPLGPTIFGTEQPVIHVTLEHAVRTAVERNLNAQFARLAPAISAAQVAAAEAAFDWVLFSNAQWSNTDQPRNTQSFTGARSEDQRNIGDTTVGVRKPLISGGQFAVQHQYVYTDTETTGVTTDPDPTHESNVVIQLDQPLLRNFGSDVAMAQVRLARNTERDEIQALKGTLLDVVTQVEEAYWNLFRARQDLLILQRLLERGEEVRRVLENRQDATPANVSNARATVEARRSDVLRAQNVLAQTSDRLKSLINDPRYPVGSEVLLLPADGAVDQPIEFSLVDAVNTAFANRPEVQRSIISIDNTSIRLDVADNARLPQLNLRGLTRFNGLGAEVDRAYGSLTEANYIDYQIGINFEMPIGNRAAEAAFSARRLERMQATLAYVNTLQGVVGEVKASLRDVITNYMLIEQTRVARIAAAEDLRTLLIERQRVPLTPDFLDLELRRQQNLAATEQQEIGALIDYSVALARLYAAMGTALERNRILFAVPPVRRPETALGDLFPDYPPIRPGEDTEQETPATLREFPAPGLPRDPNGAAAPGPVAPPRPVPASGPSPQPPAPGATDPESERRRPSGLRVIPPRRAAEPAAEPEPDAAPAPEAE